MKIVTVVGARPQFIKMAPVSKALAAVADEVVVHTGQHYDEGMSEVFFREMGIADPAYRLQVGSGSHAIQTAAMLTKTEQVIEAERPDGVLVYGDTNSTLAGALAAVKCHIPTAHVEAGPRNRDRRMPEEVNRILVDHASDILFAPTAEALANLQAEGLGPRALLVGDVMVDSLHHFLERARSTSTVLRREGLEPGRYILATLHRADNTDDPARLGAILRAFADLGQPVVLPMHPRTRKAVSTHGLGRLLDASCIKVLPPVGYLDMLMLEANAASIVTDSGGVQKEAYLLGVPATTVQDTTGWPDTLAHGWNRLVPPDPPAIREAVCRPPPPRDAPRDALGTPGASARIAEVLSEAWS